MLATGAAGFSDRLERQVSDMKERLYTPTGFFVSIGLSPAKMPDPGTRPVCLRAGGRAKEIATRALTEMGYTLTDSAEGAFTVLVTEEQAADKMLISEWIERYGALGIESVIRSMTDRGVPKQIARMLIAEHLVQANKERMAKKS